MGVVLSSITDHRQQLLNAKRIIIVACGTIMACRLDRQADDRELLPYT